MGWFGGFGNSISGLDADDQRSLRVLDLPDPIERDWDAIATRDTLTVLTTYNSTSYFLYRGQALGFEYALLNKFAEDNGVVLRMRVLRTRDSLYMLLNQGVGDVVADRVVPMAADTAYIAFTSKIYETEPVLIQQGSPDEEALPNAAEEIIREHDGSRPDGITISEDEGPTPIQLRARLIESPRDLVNEAVTLPNRSPYVETLVEISDSLTGDVQVVQLENSLSEESLMERVALGELDFTVAQHNIAELTGSYYSNLAVYPVLARPHDVAWATRINSPKLRQMLSEWLDANRGTSFFNQMYRKYFVDRKGYRERVSSEYLTGTTGKLSDYDDLFKQYAPTIGWDWRLLASQCYQESRFRPKARSWAGAMGLLQLMPATAREVDVRDAYDPEQNVAGAVRYLKWLEGIWDDQIPDPVERRKFIIASYNTGAGHVGDARRLAEKYGDDNTVWDDVAFWLLKKSERKYYQDPVVKYGYARGLEPVTYVAHILERYDHYDEFVEGNEDSALGAASNTSAASVTP